MISPAPIRRIGRLATPRGFAILAGFAIAALSSARADASCGDWLSHDPAPAVPAIATNDLPLAPQAPCNGPECRRNRNDLPLAPSGPTKQIDGPERWCRLLEDLNSRAAHSSLLPLPGDDVAADGDRLSVERPPRA